MKHSGLYILAAGMALLLSPSAHADLLTQATVASSFDPSFPGCAQIGTGFASASCSGAGFTASAVALADYGTLKVFAQATRTTSDLTRFQTGAFAQAVDSFTVLNAGAGDKFEMELDLDGFIVVPPSGTCGGAGCASDASFGINAGLFGGTGCQTTISSNVAYTKENPYRCVMDRPLDGDSFFYNIQLSASVELRSFATGTVDFSNTGVISRVVVLRPDGSIDPNAIIVTGSGVVYPNAGGVPEPASIATAAAGLAWIVCVRRKRK